MFEVFVSLSEMYIFGFRLIFWIRIWVGEIREFVFINFLGIVDVFKVWDVLVYWVEVMVFFLMGVGLGGLNVGMWRGMGSSIDFSVFWGFR